jgi:4-hydroxybenzoate polyprenyltransferase
MAKSIEANAVLLEPNSDPGRLSRLGCYIREMFPPAVYAPAGLSFFAAVYFCVQVLEVLGPVTITLRAVAGGLTTLLLLLLSRVYDDLKDADTDLRFAQAGDPRYAHRGLVEGRVQLGDVAVLRWILTALLIGINLLLGFPLPLIVFVAVMVVYWLSYRWFFWPAVRHNLLLAFVTHNPTLSLALGIYAAAVGIRDFGPTRHIGALSILLVGLWLPISAWETSRKIRHRDEETEYVTYTKLIGYRAVLLPIVFASVSVLCLVYVGIRINLSWMFPALLFAADGVLVTACICFLFFPTRTHAKLQIYSEIYVLAAWVGLPLSIACHYGVRLRL